MTQDRAYIVAWVGSHIIPHEAALRRRLRRMTVSEQEIDDIVQDTYLSIARLDSVAHIQSGRAYMFTTAKMALLQKLRRDRIIRIDQLSEIDALSLSDEAPGPEQRVSARQELERVRRLIDALPDRCRKIFELRRIQGLPQREIAARMGVSEHVVEQQAMRGLKLILKALTSEDEAAGDRHRAGDTRADEEHGHG